jgi:hypothetical protein
MQGCTRHLIEVKAARRHPSLVSRDRGRTSVTLFLRLINARAGLMLRMIRATVPGSPSRGRLDGAFRRCLACREDQACRLWLDLPRARPAAPPAFCPNARLLASLSSPKEEAPPAAHRRRTGPSATSPEDSPDGGIS